MKIVFKLVVMFINVKKKKINYANPKPTEHSLIANNNAFLKCSYDSYAGISNWLKLNEKKKKLNIKIINHR